MKKNSPSFTPEEIGSPLFQPPLHVKLEKLPGNSGPRTELPLDFRTQLNQKLRAPLNAILGFAELLEMEPSTSSKPEHVKHILDGARELLNIINQELSDSDNPSGNNDAANSASPGKCDVLYIEDDPINFTLVQRILEHRPALKLMGASRGQVGVDLAQTHKPKLILLDLNLPDIHGSEVLRLLQQTPATEKIPVIIVSADATPSQIERLLAAGAMNYLTKPLGVRHFLAIVDEVLEENAARRTA